MPTGVVKWFNNAKGYGFISPEGGGDDVFAHFTAISMDGYKTLKQGQQVNFDLVEGPRGLQATKIYPTQASSSETEPRTASISNASTEPA